MAGNTLFDTGEDFQYDIQDDDVFFTSEFRYHPTERIRYLEKRIQHLHSMLATTGTQRTFDSEDEEESVHTRRKGELRRKEFTVVRPSAFTSIQPVLHKMFSLSGKSSGTRDTMKTTGSKSIVPSPISSSPLDIPEHLVIREESSIEEMEDTTSCEWGYFCDTNDEDDTVSSSDIPSYRSFLRKEINAAVSRTSYRRANGRRCSEITTR